MCPLLGCMILASSSFTSSKTPKTSCPSALPVGITAVEAGVQYHLRIEGLMDALLAASKLMESQSLQKDKDHRRSMCIPCEHMKRLQLHLAPETANHERWGRCIPGTWWHDVRRNCSEFVMGDEGIVSDKLLRCPNPPRIVAPLGSA